ncbi:nucleoside triphosphate pyrophosphohydrolase [Aidingimonas lacisalsi]|uniref:nucleoside triphosphate pyrophosphohydrolase n=1 Tax=Aidingimonas lacisalsi TaxID=2604086 RepID=UPI0011D2925E|nr:nucleoside triphosphate pyrophosphohydrolase [Aidingimonas lacisalsi]
MSGNRYRLDDLLTLMSVLRDEQQGCPWDVKQNWDSIVPHTLEEAYEVADAIERRAFDELPGELGDLLFQVVYYSQFASEEARFDFHDVVHDVTVKMVRRHPHVFPDGILSSRRMDTPAAEVTTSRVKHRWESLKAEERAQREATSVLDDVPRTLPALSRAAKLSKRAATVGFDWPDSQGVFDKIREELAEVEEAMAAGHHDQACEEVGDLLFAVVNLSRTLKADPERCLRDTNAKFEYRFRYLESVLQAEGLQPGEVSLERMERHWQAAKRQSSNTDIPRTQDNVTQEEGTK